MIDEVLIKDALRRSMDLLYQFKASDLLRDMAAAQSLRNEVPFAFSLDDRVVHGVVDALYQSEKGQWVVVDFKTDRIKMEGVAKRTEEYLVQLGLYQAGMEMALGKPPQVIVYYLFPGVPIEIDGDMLLEVRAKVHNLFNELNTQSIHLGAKLRLVH
ncbi:MAG: PD-(D/E)XK nuclease family protein [Anaerolineae bacterium]